jgi:hypothetical protein
MKQILAQWLGELRLQEIETAVKSPTSISRPRVRFNASFRDHHIKSRILAAIYVQRSFLVFVTFLATMSLATVAAKYAA